MFVASVLTVELEGLDMGLAVRMYVSQVVGLQTICLLSRLQEERERQAQLRGPPKIDRHVAATSIQKVTTARRTFLFQGSFCYLQYEILQVREARQLM